jgi:hypothetical protein
VTIEVGEENQAVPRIPSKSLPVSLSSSAKYLVMLTVEWANVDASTHVAAAGVPVRSKTIRAASQDAVIS